MMMTDFQSEDSVLKLSKYELSPKFVTNIDVAETFQAKKIIPGTYRSLTLGFFAFIDSEYYLFILICKLFISTVACSTSYLR